jgi:hypothetical protein
MADLADEIIAALEEFSHKLENGDPIEATMVERVETPDGPMHLRRKVVSSEDRDGIQD